MPTAIVVPKASPKENKDAANADKPKGIIGWGSLLTALISILTELQPIDTYERRPEAQKIKVHTGRQKKQI